LHTAWAGEVEISVAGDEEIPCDVHDQGMVVSGVSAGVVAGPGESSVADDEVSDQGSGQKESVSLTAEAVTMIIKSRTRAAGLPETIGCNALRMTGIKLYMANGGNIEDMLVLSGLKGPAHNFRHLTVSK
jgi:hypothetical protein